MSGFFGYKLSEVAVLVLLLVAVIPVAKSAAAFNFLPIILGLLAYLTLSTVRGVSLGLRILISVLIAMIFVPSKFRGRRFYENFEDTAPLSESTTEISLTPPTSPPQGAEIAEEVKEEMEDVESEETIDNESGPSPSEVDALSAKFLGTKPMVKTKATKKYRLPSEKADGDHHMDAGSTFMKAYNQLKPEQVKALTTDTQKLISVQKDLMANLNNLKPLVSDGKEIMKTFKSFFGSDPTSS
jgi:cytoskeletal protein RodZ